MQHSINIDPHGAVAEKEYSHSLLEIQKSQLQLYVRIPYFFPAISIHSTSSHRLLQDGKLQVVKYKLVNSL